MLVGILMVGVSTMNAQILGGDLILRGGFVSNNFKGSNARGISMLPGYNVALDYNKSLKGNFYWNAGVMFGTRGFDVNFSEEKFRAHNFNLPLTIGVKYALTQKIAVDARLGGFFSVDMFGKYKGEERTLKIKDIEDYQRCDGGLLFAFGIWYNRWNIDYTFKRGFGKLWPEGASGAVNHLIRFGYAF